MPVSIATRPPNAAGREEILTKMLSKEIVDKSIDIPLLARTTESFTGSDLRELVRYANTLRAKELMKTFKEGKKKGVHEGTNGSLVMRPLQMSDFEAALLKLKKAGELYGDHISLVFNNLRKSLCFL